jgi:adenylate cyclase
LRTGRAVSGRKAAAQGLLDELEELSKKEYVCPYYKALIFTGLGEKDRAFEWLENAYEEHDFTLVILGIDPMLDALRGDSRFISLLERVCQIKQGSSKPLLASLLH